MSSAKSVLPRSVVFRLTALFTLLISFFMIVLYVILSRQLTASLYHRIDEDLHSEIVEFSERYHDGLEFLAKEFELEAESEGSERFFVSLLGSDGEMIVSSDSSAWDLQALREQAALPGKTGLEVQTIVLNVPQKRNARVITQRLGDAHMLRIVRLMHDDEQLLQSHRKTFGASLLILVAGTSFLVWLVMKKVMRGITRITDAAIAIGEGNISKRVTVENKGEEIERLALAFNDMLSKIEGLIRGLREVTDNIAHDLRSPLTRIRGAAETTLAAEENLSDYKEMASNTIEECDRLIGMINTMLFISQADSGLFAVEKKPVDLAGMIEDVCELYLPAAEDAGIRLKNIGPVQGLLAPGDKALLQRVFANLLDNALKQTPSGGEVTLAAGNGKSRIEVSVADTGSGIEPRDLPRIWDRFYRGEASRSTPGNGLGLSFVQSVVRLHQGTIDVMSQPGKGSTFTISLPRL